MQERNWFALFFQRVFIIIQVIFIVILLGWSIQALLILLTKFHFQLYI